MRTNATGKGTDPEQAGRMIGVAESVWGRTKAHQSANNVFGTTQTTQAIEQMNRYCSTP